MKNRNKAVDTDDVAGRIKPVHRLNDHMKVVLYGRSGTGKTTLACDFPGPKLLIDMNDRGTDSVRDVKGLDVLSCEEWGDFEEAYWYLKKNKGKYKTLIIDTLSMLQDLTITKVMNGRTSKNGELLTRKDWGEISSLLKVWIMNVRDLPLNVVFIAQDRVSNAGGEEDDNDGQIMPEVGPRLMPSVASTLNAAVSLIGNTFVRERVTRTKTDDKKIKEKRTIEYCLRIGPHAYYTTKVRKPKSIEVPSFLVNPTYKELVATLEE
jgi:phage nucleotide-binding protein